MNLSTDRLTLTNLHSILEALQECFRTNDQDRLDVELARLELWGKHILRASSAPDNIDLEDTALRGFDSAIMAYSQLLQILEALRLSIDIIQQTESFEQLPQSLELIKNLHGRQHLRLIINASLFGSLVPSSIAAASSIEMHDHLAALTPAPYYPRLFLDAPDNLEDPEFFIGGAQAHGIRHAAIFALGHRRKPGEVLGFLTLADTTPLRATDLILAEHTSDVLAGNLLNTLDRSHLEELTVRDSLTGINNRAYLERHAQRILDFADREKFSLHLLFLDLNGFKAINDTLGHDAGDLLLCEVAQRVQSMIRRYDIFVRFGGDEFIIILPGADTEKAQAFIARLRTILGSIDVSAICAQKTDLNISTAIGTAAYTPGATLESLIREADQRMFEDKTKNAKQR